MLHRPDPFNARCPTRQVLDRVGDKWAVLVMILLEDGPLQLALRTMNFLHGGFYTLRIALVRQQRIGQLPICLTNRRDQFIPAPRKLSFNRFQLAFLFGAKT